MTVIGSKEVAAMLQATEGYVKDRVKPSTPRRLTIPHFSLPGGEKRRQVRFHRETIQQWIDAGCPALDSWRPGR